MLNAFASLKCSKKCEHNVQRPTDVASQRPVYICNASTFLPVPDVPNGYKIHKNYFKGDNIFYSLWAAIDASTLYKNISLVIFFQEGTVTNPVI